MGKAKVSISCVEKFLNAVSKEDSAAKKVKSSSSCIEDVISKAKTDKSKLVECERSCKAAISSADAKIARLEKEIDEINSHKPPEYEEKEVTVGYDEDGNAITRTEKYLNPKYEAAMNRINALQGRINSISSLKQLLVSQLVIIEKSIHTFENSISGLSSQKSAISEKCSSLGSKCEKAKTQLRKAIDAIEKYIHENVRLDDPPYHVPSYNSYFSSGASFSSASYPTYTPKRVKEKPVSVPAKKATPPSPPPKMKAASPKGGAKTFTVKWRKSDAPANTAKALLTTNPNYYMGDKWQKNCQRCVPTYEMARRGYCVKANPKIAPKDHLSLHPFDVWVNPKVISCSGSGLETIKEQMTSWGNGARAQVVIYWKNFPSGHTFVAEQQGGRTIFVDPQCNDFNVSHYFKDARPECTKFCRMDNLEPTQYILDCCEEI